MTRTEWVGLVVLAASSASAGWFVGRQSQPSPPPAVVLAGAPAVVRPPAPVADSVSVHPDGTASIVVSRASLPWLLEEIARQGGRTDAFPASPGVVPAAVAGGDETQAQEACARPVSPARLLQALREGTAVERLAALADALANDVEVPHNLLQALVETDPSEAVRLAAFDATVDRAGGDVDAVRGILEAARYNPSAAVQADARRRRDELERALQMRPPDDPQQRP